MSKHNFRMVVAGTVAVHPVPGSVFLKLRHLEDCGKVRHQVHSELSPAHALALADTLREAARKAILGGTWEPSQANLAIDCK